jgi:altronate hydrolase
VRDDGRVATRNYIGVLTSVNCSATAARAIADHFRRDIRPEALADFPNVDGVVALTHGMGCATASDGEELQVLRRTLGGYARHANFYAVLVVGLGCETNQIQGLVAQEGLSEGARLVTFSIQDTGGTAKTVAKGVEIIRSLLPDANRVQRQPVPARHLMVGLQCGGSDGYSGISANPALGAAVDRLVRHGGTAILSETPEIYGGEHLLTRRAVSREVSDKLLARIAWWEAYTRRNQMQMDNNPSAGNKAGGLTTILEKSLGAIAKSGTTNLVDVVEFAQTVRAAGFVYMDTPGYDPVSATGQVAGGANLICFTTGRGSAYGCAPSPSLKLSTNTALWLKQQDDIDIDCGGIVEGLETVDQVGARIFQLMLDTASGRATKSEGPWLRPERVRALATGRGDVVRICARSVAGRAAQFVVGFDQRAQHAHELGPVGRRQRRQHAGLRTLHAGQRLCQQVVALVGQGQQPHAAVVGRRVALHQRARFQPVDHAGDGRGVEADAAGQRALVDAGCVGHRLQRRVLHRRDAGAFGLLQEDGHRDLLQAADVVAGEGFEVDRRGLLHRGHAGCGAARHGSSAVQRAQAHSRHEQP